jgi:hypothetical protein
VTPVYHSPIYISRSHCRGLALVLPFRGERCLASICVIYSVAQLPARRSAKHSGCCLARRHSRTCWRACDRGPCLCADAADLQSQGGHGEFTQRLDVLAHREGRPGLALEVAQGWVALGLADLQCLARHRIGLLRQEEFRFQPLASAAASCTFFGPSGARILSRTG